HAVGGRRRPAGDRRALQALKRAPLRSLLSTEAVRDPFAAAQRIRYPSCIGLGQNRPADASSPD
ncbi:hypothetical protein, partial [Burkholderia oklahomensis]|uniref:hypothetical protein n=1 Tax=Burkholderia oklahomensis TaxID=342113 RepID=UPI001E619577